MPWPPNGRRDQPVIWPWSGLNSPQRVLYPCCSGFGRLRVEIRWCEDLHAVCQLPGRTFRHGVRGAPSRPAAHQLEPLIPTPGAHSSACDNVRAGITRIPHAPCRSVGPHSSGRGDHNPPGPGSATDIGRDVDRCVPAYCPPACRALMNNLPCLDWRVVPPWIGSILPGLLFPQA